MVVLELLTVVAFGIFGCVRPFRRGARPSRAVTKPKWLWISTVVAVTEAGVSWAWVVHNPSPWFLHLLPPLGVNMGMMQQGFAAARSRHPDMATDGAAALAEMGSGNWKLVVIMAAGALTFVAAIVAAV